MELDELEAMLTQCEGLREALFGIAHGAASAAAAIAEGLTLPGTPERASVIESLERYRSTLNDPAPNSIERFIVEAVIADLRPPERPD